MLQIGRTLAACLLAAVMLTLQTPAYAQEDDGADAVAELDPAQVEETIMRVAAWQMAHTVHYPPEHWAMAPLYDGLIDTALVTGDPTYLAPVVRAGLRVGYTPGKSLEDADSHAAGHAWLRIYLMDPARNPEILATFQAHFEESLQEHPPGTGWSWADALYMAPPTLIHLGKAAAEARL